MTVVYILLILIGCFIIWCLIGVALTLHSTRLENKILKDLKKSNKHKFTPVVMVGIVEGLASIIIIHFCL